MWVFIIIIIITIIIIYFLWIRRAWLVTELLSFKFWISCHFNTTFRNKGKNSQCFISSTNWGFGKKSHLFLSCHGLSKSSTFYDVIWKLSFAVNLVTSFSGQKRWNSNHENMKSSKFYNPAKFQLKQIKTVRAVFYWSVSASLSARRVIDRVEISFNVTENT